MHSNKYKIIAAAAIICISGIFVPGPAGMSAAEDIQDTTKASSRKILDLLMRDEDEKTQSLLNES